MGSWYDAPAPDNEACANIPIANTRSIRSDRDTLYTLDLLNARFTMEPHWLASYLKDVANVLSHIESKVEHGPETSRLVVLRIGDSSSTNTQLPVVAKSRRVVNSTNEESAHSSIIWPVRIGRHFDGPLRDLKMAKDTPWEEKRDAIVWRGSCTGLGTSSLRFRFVQKYGTHQNRDIDIGMVGGMIGSCAGGKLDAKHSKETMTVEDMLKYKYMLSLEGNDVATGLKWQLASSSVVFMPKPTTESFAMESLMVPFVHYIPIKSDGSDIEEMLTWAKSNDDKARWISEQASKYMDDLWFSDQAKEDNILVRNQLGNIYHKKFGDVLRECYEDKNA